MSFGSLSTHNSHPIRRRVYMARYAVGSFVPGRSGSPHQFVSLDLQPAGPYAILNTKYLRINPPKQGMVYLFQLEDCPPRNVQGVTRIVAPLADITRKIHDALLDAQWEMVMIKGRWQLRLVQQIVKTEFGYFEPEYHSGLNAFGPGQDVDPFFEVCACSVSLENPYGDALGTELARRHMPCLNEAEIERVKYPEGGRLSGRYRDDLTN